MCNSCISSVIVRYNKRVLRWLLNIVSVSDAWTWVDKLFHAAGPATGKPSFQLVVIFVEYQIPWGDCRESWYPTLNSETCMPMRCLGPSLWSVLSWLSIDSAQCLEWFLTFIETKLTNFPPKVNTSNIIIPNLSIIDRLIVGNHQHNHNVSFCFTSVYDTCRWTNIVLSALSLTYMKLL